MYLDRKGARYVACMAAVAVVALIYGLWTWLF